MHIFDDDITQLRTFVASRRKGGRSVRILNRGSSDQGHKHFSAKNQPTIVFSEDTWLELGHPDSFSIAAALVTEKLGLVNNGDITLIGPDIPEVRGRRSFAQILLISSSWLQDEDYRLINTYQYELELAGYMIKAVPSSLTIWSRVSNEIAEKGFSFGTLGKIIIENYKSRFSIDAMEVVFVTSSLEDVEALRDLRLKVTRILSAMNKMIEEMSFDCSSCEYLDVCGDARQLGALRDRLMKQKKDMA